MLPGTALFAGGKSFGARMTSQAQVALPLPGVPGLVFPGFPLHPAKQPSDARADHLREVPVPLLFVQGTRDARAHPGLRRPVAQGLEHATLHIAGHADHSFHVPVRSGRTGGGAMTDLLDTAAGWMRSVAATGTAAAHSAAIAQNPPGPSAA